MLNERGEVAECTSANIFGVKDGKIDPAEADEMIAALMEVERATESPRDGR